MRHARVIPAPVAALGAAAALTVVLAGCGGPSGSPSLPSTTAKATTTTTTRPSGGSSQSSAAAAAAVEQAFVAVVSKVRPQVVLISTGSGLGSGVIYDSTGDVVTNAHVVGSATRFTVQLADGQQFPATLVGSYVPDDLAVVKLEGAKNLSAATFANSDAVQVGDIVFAVGNPLGLSSSVTDGIVSYNGRPVGERNGVVLPSTIQTSAPINPGNSGGALVDLAGQVIGIPTLAAVEQQGGAAPGIGFAIPSNIVKLIVPQLIATGHVTHSDRASLGVTAVDGVDSSGTPIGAIVVGVTPGGSAAEAGIRVGELITALAGTKVSSLADLQSVLAQLAPGQKVSVVLLDQDGTTRDVTALLGQLQG